MSRFCVHAKFIAEGKIQMQDSFWLSFTLKRKQISWNCLLCVLPSGPWPWVRELYLNWIGGNGQTFMFVVPKIICTFCNFIGYSLGHLFSQPIRCLCCTYNNLGSVTPRTPWHYTIKSLMHCSGTTTTTGNNQLNKHCEIEANKTW